MFALSPSIGQAVDRVTNAPAATSEEPEAGLAQRRAVADFLGLLILFVMLGAYLAVNL